MKNMGDRFKRFAVLKNLPKHWQNFKHNRTIYKKLPVNSKAQVILLVHKN